MIYPTQGNDWNEYELKDLVARLNLREPSEPFLGHAADAIEFLMNKVRFQEELTATEEDLKDLRQELEFTIEEARRLLSATGALKKCLNTLTQP